MRFWSFPGNPVVEGFPLDWSVPKDPGSSIFARYDAKRYVTLGVALKLCTALRGCELMFNVCRTVGGCAYQEVITCLMNVCMDDLYVLISRWSNFISGRGLYLMRSKHVMYPSSPIFITHYKGRYVDPPFCTLAPRRES